MIEYMFDTTFILPYCRITVNIGSINKYLMKIENRMREESKKIALSSLSILEAKWKAISITRKEHIQGLLKNTNIAIDSITKNDLFEVISSENNASIQSLADNLYSLGHSDYIDCLIFSTAKFHGLKIITLDKTLKKLVSKSDFWKDLTILSWKEFIIELDLEN